MTSTTSQPLAALALSHVPARRLWRGAVIAAATATAAIEIYAAAARAVGVTVKAGFLGGHRQPPDRRQLRDRGPGLHLLGAILATALARKAAHPARAFVRITAGLTIVSLAVPAGVGATATATKATLAAAHILVASIVIPVLTRHLRPARRAH